MLLMFFEMSYCNRYIVSCREGRVTDVTVTVCESFKFECMILTYYDKI